MCALKTQPIREGRMPNNELLSVWSLKGSSTFALLLFLLCVATMNCQCSLSSGAIQPRTREDSLFKASSKGEVNEVIRLLDEGTHVDAREQEGETPLMYASTAGRTDVVKVLLDRGASINAVSNNGETALVRAIRVRQHDMVALLLNRGADVEKSADAQGTTLMAASGADEPKIIELLLTSGANVNAVDSEGYTALSYAVSRRASAAAVRLLLAAGADTSIRNIKSETALMIAKKNGDQAIINLLTTTAH